MNFVLVIWIAVCVSILANCNFSIDVGIDVNIFDMEVAFSFMLDLPAWHRVEELPMSTDEEAILAVDPGDSVEDLVYSRLTLSVLGV